MEGVVGRVGGCGLLVEDHRVLGGLHARLRHVVGVVETHGQDLGRAQHGRLQVHVRKGQARRFGAQSRLGCFEGRVARLEEGQHLRRKIGGCSPQVDDFIALE